MRQQAAVRPLPRRGAGGFDPGKDGIGCDRRDRHLFRAAETGLPGSRQRRQVGGRTDPFCSRHQQGKATRPGNIQPPQAGRPGESGGNGQQADRDFPD
jgi:hypothetical protein